MEAIVHCRFGQDFKTVVFGRRTGQGQLDVVSSVWTWAKKCTTQEDLVQSRSSQHVYYAASLNDQFAGKTEAGLPKADEADKNACKHSERQLLKKAGARYGLGRIGDTSGPLAGVFQATCPGQGLERNPETKQGTKKTRGSKENKESHVRM